MIFENLLIRIIVEKKKLQIKIDLQFIIIESEKIFTLGSKDENKFIIYIKIFLKKMRFLF